MIFAKPDRGTGGAGMSGILQGMIAGQQSKESSQRMDWLQTQQDRQTEVYEQDKAFGHIGNIDDMQRSGKYDQKVIDNANEWFKGSTNFADTKFSLRNINSLKDENGNWTNQLINEYKSKTGKTVIPGSTKTAEGLKTYVDRNGNQVMVGDDIFDPDTFTAGSSNYKKYKANKDMERRLQESMIAKNLGIKAGGAGEPKYDKTQAMADKTRIEEIDPKDRSDKDVMKLKVADQTLGMTKNEAIGDLVGTEFKDTFSSINSGDFSKMGNITDDQRSRINNAQLQGGTKYEGYDATNKELNTMNILYDLSDKFNGLDGSNYESGVVNKMVRDYATMADEKGWENINQTDRDKMLNTIMKGSEVGMATAQILKDISGAAVSDEEFQRIMKILTGGDVDLKNPASVAAALRGAGDTMGNRSKTAIRGIRELYSPSDKLKLAELYNQYYRPFKGHKQKPGGDATPKQAAVKVAKAEADVASELGVDLFQEFTGMGTPEYNEDGTKKTAFTSNPLGWFKEKLPWGNDRSDRTSSSSQQKNTKKGNSKYGDKSSAELMKINRDGMSADEIRELSTAIRVAKLNGR